MTLRCIPAIAALLAAALAAPAQAGESAAKSLNLTGERPARFEAKVVDVLCELGGECAENCGDGARYLGLLKPDGVLVFAQKNIQPLFTGAAIDLLPYCGKQVEVDGLFVGKGMSNLYQVQLIRKVGGGEFAKTNRWTKVWDAENPVAANIKGPWFRKDPRVNALIRRNGYLGLGLEADKTFIEEWE